MQIVETSGHFRCKIRAHTMDSEIHHLNKTLAVMDNNCKCSNVLVHLCTLEKMKLVR